MDDDSGKQPFHILKQEAHQLLCNTGADPGFPVGGGANPHWRGHQPLTQVFFGENICKNERIWSCWGGGARWKLLYVDPPLQ